MKASVLAESLLRDRAERAVRPRAVTSNVGRDEFDPFAVTRWRVIADGEGYQRNTKGRKGPGYLPTTKMRRGPVGWFIECQHCYREFESKGLAYCQACMELPAEERRANRKPQDYLARVRATGHRTAVMESPAASPRAEGNVNIEEFPPVLGFADFPSILVGSGKRGKALPPDLAKTILDIEIAKRS
jgi:hypothetical protein